MTHCIEVGAFWRKPHLPPVDKNLQILLHFMIWSQARYKIFGLVVFSLVVSKIFEETNLKHLSSTDLKDNQNGYPKNTSSLKVLPAVPSRVHFVTFASKSLESTLTRIQSEASIFFNFTSVHLFTEANIPDSILSKLGVPSILKFAKSHPRGFGYWIWKFAIVFKLVMSVPIGDILIYADAGCSFNVNGRIRFNYYLEYLLNSPDSLVVFQLGHLEKKFTKRATIQQLQCDSVCQNSGQIIATSFLIRNSMMNRKFLQKILSSITIGNSWLLIDPASRAHEADYFFDHRHDQSIFSVLVKQRASRNESVLILPDETFEVFNGQFGSSRSSMFPIWATRNRG
jgi:hypothetical protein